MNNPVEQLLSSLPKQKLSRTADLKIRFRLFRVQLAQTWQTTDLSLAKGWQAGLAFALVLLIGLSSTGVYAYSSDKVTRQSRLYPVKRTLEQIEKAVTKNPVAQSGLQAKLAARRLAEARSLVDNAADLNEINNDLDATLSEARKNIESANEDIESIESENDQEQAIRQLGEENRKHTRSLEQIADKLSLDDEMTVDAVAATFEGLERQRNLLKDHPKKGRNSEKQRLSTSTPETSAPNVVPAPASTSPITSSASKKKEKSDELQSLNRLKKRVKSFKQEQESKQSQTPNPKTEKLIKNLEKKINRAESSIEQGDKETFIKLYRSTSALTDTADHFIASSSDRVPERMTESEEENKQIPESGGTTAGTSDQTLRQAEERHTEETSDENVRQTEERPSEGDRRDSEESD